MEQCRRRRNQLPSNLPQLQNLIKRSPSAYREEVGVLKSVEILSHYQSPSQFMQQYSHYQSLRQLLLLSPMQNVPNFSEMLTFLGQVLQYYDAWIRCDNINAVARELVPERNFTP